MEIATDAENPAGSTALPRAIKLTKTRQTARSDCGRLILVAEDDPTFRDAVRRFLSKRGFAVLDASTHAEALQLWRDHYPSIDVVVTDVNGVDGLELAEAVESDCPEKPIVLMTADSAALPTPPHPILRKPFRLDDLIAAIRRALGQE